MKSLYAKREQIIEEYPGTFTYDEIEQLSQEAGKLRVKQGFYNPDDHVFTSTDGTTYAEYYGNFWDSIHDVDVS